MVKVHNLRLGHSTNSSSTHSIIFAKSLANIEDNYEGYSFGWDFFTCVSKEAKLRYLAATLASNMYNVDNATVQAIVLAWTDVDLTTKELNGFQVYVDHQSLIALPRSRTGKGINKDFFDDLKSFIMRESIVILGGNDNTEEEHPLINRGPTVMWYPNFREGPPKC